MFPLKSNLLPWKHFSLRSKQGMDRKEQEACNGISKREKHLRKGDEKAGWPDAGWERRGSGEEPSLKTPKYLYLTVSTEEEEGQGHRVQGRRHELAEKRPFTGSRHEFPS